MAQRLFSTAYDGAMSDGGAELALRARKLLNLPSTHAATEQEVLSTKQLRLAYFQAAKMCHPDTIDADNGSLPGSAVDKKAARRQESANQFMRVTEAYEFLLSRINPSKKYSASDLVSEKEEGEFRRNCQDWLGIPADVVEESKRCPLFREWLKGNTDAAHHWKIFLMQNGGLAPRLRATVLVEAGEEGPGATSRRRRSR
eukprot:CAMPEP_0196811684 /NCGR_PEP_ID=MMETSP1362-20130617/19907_1 /TAXON_ID=163516 /ORGANISM="Leptocylindrus danicus, Strain CCMP1856" /LENGTH=199 /DNA_ID=CAMNT_0042187059 /DNA_START=62 /DNA_END=661 /DNA_ORIENTATION=+